MFGEALIRWTARFAVTCYVMRLMIGVSSQGTISSKRAARWWWTAGCACFFVHVATAFHFEHGWNHAAAFESTARRTAEMTGWKSGVGLYVNEAFLLLWVMDLTLWWIDLKWPQNRVVFWTVQGIFSFLMIQATAVFGPPFWKVVMPFVFACLLVQFIRQER